MRARARAFPHDRPWSGAHEELPIPFLKGPRLVCAIYLRRRRAAKAGHCTQHADLELCCTDRRFVVSEDLARLQLLEKIDWGLQTQLGSATSMTLGCVAVGEASHIAQTWAGASRGEWKVCAC